MDLYKILCVGRGATVEQIKNRYRALAMKHHPDQSGSEDSQKFKDISLAYEVLSDPERRKRYDETGSTASIDDERREVQEMISTVYVDLLKKLLTAGRNPAEVDMLSKLKSYFRDTKLKLGDEIVSLSNGKERLEKVAARFKKGKFIKEAEPNLLRDVTLAPIREITAELEKTRRQAAICKMAIAELDTYSYDFTPKDSGSTHNYSSWHTLVDHEMHLRRKHKS